jgi:ribosome-binding factor A
MTDFSRSDRISEQMLRELSRLIQQETKDPRLQSVVIQAVKLSKDLSHARVYVTVMGKMQADSGEEVAVLNKAAGFFRTELGKVFKLRFMPKLHFVFDGSQEYASHIEALLQKALRKE